MALTMFLLGLVYAVLIAVAIGSGASIAGVLTIAIALFTVQLLASDRIALATLGARTVSVEQAPALHAIVERLCVQADLPMPRLAIVEAPMPNAFALGRSQKSATVC